MDLEKQKQKSVLPEGKSSAELFDAPRETIEQLAQQWNVPPDRALELLLNAALRYEEDAARKETLQKSSPGALRNVARDERAERIRAEVIKTIADADIETAPRDPLRAEAAEQEAYKLLNETDSVADEAKREDMLTDARRLFRESIWLSSLHNIDGAREQGTALDEACGKVAEDLRARAKENGKNMPRELWVSYNAIARRFERQQEHTGMYEELRNLARSLRSETPTAEAQEMLRRLVSVARGAYIRRGAEETVLRGYHLERFAPIVGELADAYRRTAGHRTDRIGEEPLGPGEVFSANAQEAGGFAGAAKKSRPRRLNDELEPY